MKKLLGLLTVLTLFSIPISMHAQTHNQTTDPPAATDKSTDNRTADQAVDKKKIDTRLQSSQAVLDSIMSAKDSRIPENIASKAKCIAVVPGLVKGAFIVGAEYGQGVVTCRTEHGFSAPVFIRMAGGSWGLQAGGKGTDLVLVAMNQKGIQDLLKSKFEIGAGASAAAGPVGRSAQAATDLSMKSELLAWSRAHGLFAGVDLKGVTVSQNLVDTAAMYGKLDTYKQILSGAVPPPPAAKPFLSTVAEYFNEAKKQHTQASR